LFLFEINEIEVGTKFDMESEKATENRKTGCDHRGYQTFYCLIYEETEGRSMSYQRDLVINGLQSKLETAMAANVNQRHWVSIAGDSNG